MSTQREEEMNDETPLRLTDHELLALLAVNPTPSAETTRTVFRLSPVADNELLEQAGITTLLVRGLAEVSGDDIVPVDKGAIVAAVVSTADEWLELALVTPQTDHVLFTAGSKDGALLLNLNRYGVHEVQPVDPGAGMLQLGLQIARHYLETGAEGYPAAAMIKHHRLSGPPLTAHLKVEADQSWTLATGDDGADKAEAIDAADAFRRFESALTF
ncbi:hypothetical protein [Arthrobacter sp. EPSL27]|uniref:hypothetical protein n=1 Tax=Arthrobacter sp. EPSL27 TaxID=1745378 RepID=UPI001E372412|nr:hypothetical protein [Arthrobacter sp. EPSL27]